MPLHIENIKKSFGTKKVLTGISFTLEDNGIYCLMGPSGMGKTTLLRLLLGRETADCGCIEGIMPGEISAMFQEDRLVPTLSAVQNVALVCRTRAKPRELVKELAEILPENCLHQPVSQLSGGMKRRVALARAMHYPSKMIILDEPFTGLDQDTRLKVISYLLKLREDRILLVATHGAQDAALLGAKIIRLDELQGGTEDHEEEEILSLSREEAFLGLTMFRDIKARRFDAVVEKLGGYEKEYCSGETIWHQLEKHSEIGVILSGSIQALDVSHEEPQIIQIFEAGNSFGEAVAFGTQNSWVEIRASAGSRILFLPAENIKKNSQDPEIMQITINLLSEFSDKLNMLNLKNRLLSEPRLRSRILMYFGTLSEGENRIRNIPFSQKAMAQYLNVNRTALNRELGRMKEEGIIDIYGNQVRLLKNVRSDNLDDL